MEQVVLLPGLMCDERLFEPLIKLLKPNYRVHVPIMDTQKSIAVSYTHLTLPTILLV